MTLQEPSRWRKCLKRNCLNCNWKTILNSPLYIMGVKSKALPLHFLFLYIVPFLFPFSKLSQLIKYSILLNSQYSPVTPWEIRILEEEIRQGDSNTYFHIFTSFGILFFPQMWYNYMSEKMYSSWFQTRAWKKLSH